MALRDEIHTVLVECLQCGERRDIAERPCARCSYVGWAATRDLNESLRRLLRERPPADRRLRAV